jgi:hypothetical protein
MISLAIFTSKNSFPTYIATLESFFDKCEDLFLINEIILVDDRSDEKNRRYYLEAIKKILNINKITIIHKNNNSVFNHAEICETFRAYIINSKNKYVFILEDDWFFIKNFSLKCFSNILEKESYSQILLTNAINLFMRENLLDLKMSSHENFYLNNQGKFYTISERVEKNIYLWHEVYGYNHFSLNPSLTKIEFLNKNGEFSNTITFEIDYNIKASHNGMDINLLSGDPYAVHIGKYKKLWQDI